jgi:hypothetical protein
LSHDVTRPDAPSRLPRWGRQLIWFVALWCLSVAMLGAISFAIRFVLFR